ncbi:MAG: hypothetical protein AB7G93_15635 [Bdellovibrionales bacterium]
MAKKDAKETAQGGTVVPMNTTCCVEKCTKKADRLGFCPEHYTWFKEGLINKKGQKPSDFDKKYQAFTNRKKVA